MAAREHTELCPTEQRGELVDDKLQLAEISTGVVVVVCIEMAEEGEHMLTDREHSLSIARDGLWDANERETAGV